MPVYRNGFPDPPKLIYRSAALAAVNNLITQLAASDCSVLITGESGTGKGVIAALLHARSSHPTAPYGKINCAAIPETNLETELFGVAKRSFSEVDEREGILEACNGGTFFLDEIGEMPPALQAKFLNVLEGEPFSRVGSTRAISSKVRFIYATNRDLLAAVEAGRLREDLYHRIKGMEIHLPPLREHPEDILSLVLYFHRFYAEHFKQPNLEFSSEAMSLLTRHPWPGNVRELQKAIEQTTLLCRGPSILPEHLPESVRSQSGGTPRSIPTLRAPRTSDPPQRTRPPFPSDPNYERIFRSALVHDVLTNHLSGARVATLLQTHRGGGRTLARQLAPRCYGMQPVWLSDFSSENTSTADFYQQLTNNKSIQNQAEFGEWLSAQMTEKGVLVILLGTRGPVGLLEEVAAKVRSLLAGHHASAFLVVGGERLLRIRKHEQYSWYRLLPASSFVDVPDLSQSEVAALMRERKQSDQRAAMIWESTGGHPWLVYELIRKGISDPVQAMEVVKYHLKLTGKTERHLADPQAYDVIQKMLRCEEVASLADPCVRHEPGIYAEARMYLDGLLSWDRKGNTQLRCPAVRRLFGGS